MKIILLKDVQKVGKKFEVKNVSDGYALNHLIPSGFAEAATPAAMKRAEALKARKAVEENIQHDLLMKNLSDLKDLSIEVMEAANEKGHLFKGIHKGEILDILRSQKNLVFLPEHILLEKPIKEVGEHDIAVKVGNGSGTFTLVVKGKGKV